MVKNLGVRNCISEKDLVRVRKVLKDGDFEVVKRLYDAIENDCNESEFLGWLKSEIEVRRFS